MSRYAEKCHAELYRKYRRNTPEVVIKEIITWMTRPPKSDFHGPQFDTAVDVGCGSGQHTLPLAPYFRSVHGYDQSEAQISQARELPALPPHVDFTVAPAEHLPLRDRSVQLLTGNLSFHFFDLDKFYTEVDRVLVPGGVVAATGHNALMSVVDEIKGQELNQLMEEFFARTMTRGRHQRSGFTDNSYRDLPMPYQEAQRLTSIPFDVKGTLDDVIGALSARGSFQALYREDSKMAAEAVEWFRSEFMRVLGLDAVTPADQVQLLIRYNYFVVMCRKPCPETDSQRNGEKTHFSPSAVIVKC